MVGSGGKDEDAQRLITNNASPATTECDFIMKSLSTEVVNWQKISVVRPRCNEESCLG